MEMLADMPLSFVHRLRDIRCEQLKQQHNVSTNTNNNNNNWIKSGVQNSNSAYNESDIEDLIDEFQ